VRNSKSGSKITKPKSRYPEPYALYKEFLGARSEQPHAHASALLAYSTSASPTGPLVGSQLGAVSSALENMSLIAPQPAMPVLGKPPQCPGIFEYPRNNFHSPDKASVVWWELAEKFCREAWESSLNTANLPDNDLLTIARPPGSIKSNFKVERNDAWAKVRTAIEDYICWSPKRRACQNLTLSVFTRLKYNATSAPDLLAYKGEYLCEIRGPLETDDLWMTPFVELISHGSALPVRESDWRDVYEAEKRTRRRMKKGAKGKGTR